MNDSQIKYVSVVPQEYTDDEKLQAIENLNAYSVTQNQELSNEKLSNLRSYLPKRCYATVLGSYFTTVTVSAISNITYYGTLYNEDSFYGDLELIVPLDSSNSSIILLLGLYKVTLNSTKSTFTLVTMLSAPITSKLMTFSTSITDYDLVNKNYIWGYSVTFMNITGSSLSIGYLSSVSAMSCIGSYPSTTQTVTLTTYGTVIPGLIVREV